MQEACAVDAPIHTVTGDDALQYAAVLGVGVAGGSSEGIAQLSNEVGITIHR